MGTNPKFCLLGSTGGRSLVIFQSRKVEFFLFFKDFFIFGGVGWGGWRKGVGIFLFYFSFVIWRLNEEFFLEIYFIKVN